MALGYLISPALQVEDESGKPLVGGTVVVYRHGTTIPYITWKNFNGDRNPARVELDALGMCILLADDALLYDVYCYDRNGVQQWSRLNVSATTGGGGGVEPGEEMSVLRCDATDLTQSGPFVFESLSQDGEGAYVDSQGHVRLAQGTWHYDITVEVDYSPVSGSASTTNLVLSTLLNRSCLDFDLSYAHTGTLRLSGLVNVTDDGTVFGVGMGGMATGMTASVVDFGIFEVVAAGGESWQYYEPGEGIDIDGNVIKVDTSEIQEKLTAGTGIIIENNVISASGSFTQVQSDWAQSDSSAVDYIKNKPAIPTVDQTYDASSTHAQSGTAVAEAIAGVDNTFIAVYGVTTIGEVDTAYAQGKDILCRYNSHGHVYSSQLSSLVSGIYTFTTTDGFTDYEFTLSPNGGTGAWSISSRAIPSGAQLVPEATASDAGEVLTVDQNGVPEWAPAQAPISAGNGIDITNNVISIDTSVVATQNDLAGCVQDPFYVHTDNNFTNADVTKLSGIESGAEVNVQANWAETDSTSDSFIQNKPAIPVVPAMKELVAGTNVAITESASSVTISATAASQVNADWNATSGVAEILNKPTIPELPTMKELVAGSGVTITEGSTDVTISATGATYTAGTGIDITNGVISADTTVLALKSELPAIGTITL